MTLDRSPEHLSAGWTSRAQQVSLTASHPNALQKTEEESFGIPRIDNFNGQDEDEHAWSQLMEDFRGKGELSVEDIEMFTIGIPC